MSSLAIFKILLYLVGSIQLALLLSVPPLKIGNTNYLRTMFFGLAMYSYAYLFFYQTGNVFVARLATTSASIITFYAAVFFISLTGLKVKKYWLGIFKSLSLIFFILALSTNIYPDPHIVGDTFITGVSTLSYAFTIYVIVGYVFMYINNVLHRSKNRAVQALIYSFLTFAAIAIALDAIAPLFITDTGPFYLLAPASSAIFAIVFFYQIHKASDIDMRQSITRFAYILFVLLAAGILIALDTPLALVRYATFLILITTAAIVYAVIRREQNQHRILHATHQATAAYLADIAHRLKTPLAIIQFKTSPDQPLNKTAQAEINEVTKSTVATLRNIVQTGKIDAELASIELEPTIVTEWIQSMQNDFAALAPHHVIHISAEGHDVANIDPRYLRETLLNLIDNARKFSPVGSTIAITVAPSHHDIEITVADSGVGISAAALPHIFERHYQSHRAKQQFAGSAGLGLSLVKWVVEEHGGHIDITSKPGHGTTFHLLFPVTKQDLPAPHKRIKEIVTES